jgi:hypothetical protein
VVRLLSGDANALLRTGIRAVPTEAFGIDEIGEAASMPKPWRSYMPGSDPGMTRRRIARWLVDGAPVQGRQQG